MYVIDGPDAASIVHIRHIFFICGLKDLFIPGLKSVRNRTCSDVLDLRSTTRLPNGRDVASSNHFINVTLVDGYILLAKVATCCLSIGLLNKTRYCIFKAISLHAFPCRNTF